MTKKSTTSKGQTTKGRSKKGQTTTVGNTALVPCNVALEVIDVIEVLQAEVVDSTPFDEQQARKMIPIVPIPKVGQKVFNTFNKKEFTITAIDEESKHHENDAFVEYATKPTSKKSHIIPALAFYEEVERREEVGAGKGKKWRWTPHENNTIECTQYTANGSLIGTHYYIF